ncbi:MAG: AraC family transcriptional regulator [Piscinibacter sp.]|nr:AraC family transcriptional regulator [Piscinibacter sp.]
MNDRHARSSAPDARPSGVDVLSDVLGSIRLTGAMLFLVEAAEPWITWAPAAEAFRPAVLPDAEHLISYHVVLQGACWAGLQGRAPERFERGDVMVVPHGDAYFLADPADAPPAYGADEAVDFFRCMAAGELPPQVQAGARGRAATRFLCGFLGCARRPFNPVLGALPPLLHLRPPAGGSGRLRHLIAFAQDEVRQRPSGSNDVLARLAELMFVEVVRRHLDSLGRTERGWLAGLKDPLVARALALLHGAPARAWTLETLADAAGGSRSVLAERFVQFVGQPPMRYLAQWRMQLAARLLGGDRPPKLAAVAEAVGYASEGAFSRAFVRATGQRPGAWRRGAGGVT